MFFFQNSIPYNCYSWIVFVISICFFALIPPVAMGQTTTSEVVVNKAVFGSGRAAVDITDRFREIIEDKNTITTISSAGLQVRNRRAYARDKLKIWFSIDERTHYVELENGISLNFFNALLNYHESMICNETKMRGTAEPKIVIDEALFGTGRGSGNATARIREIIKDKNALTKISSEGLKIKNPSGAFRDKLKIWYRVENERRYLEIKNDENINIYLAMIEHHVVVSSGKVKNEAELKDFTYKIEPPASVYKPEANVADTAPEKKKVKSASTSDSTQASKPKLVVDRAIFGSGSHRTLITFRIREIIKNKDVKTTLTSDGLGLRKSRGYERAILKIWYSVDGVKRYLKIQHGVRINLYQGMLIHHDRITASEKGNETHEKKVKSTLEVNTSLPDNSRNSSSKHFVSNSANEKANVIFSEGNLKLEHKFKNPTDVISYFRDAEKLESKTEQYRANEETNSEAKTQSTKNIGISDDPVVIQIPKRFGEIRFGGNGQFIALHSGYGKTIFVLDVAQKKTIKEIPVDGAVKFACSRKKLIIISEKNKTIDCWDLNLMKRESSRPWSFGDMPQAIAMGDGGEGPLGLWMGGKLQFLDIQTMELILQDKPTLVSSKNGTKLHVSANGQTFCAYHQNNASWDLLSISDEETFVRTQTISKPSSEWAVPGFDGQYLFASHGRVFGFDSSTPKKVELNKQDVFPFGGPRFLLKFARNADSKLDMSILSAADFDPIYTINNVPNLNWDTKYQHRTGVAFQQRARFLEDRNLLVIIPQDNAVSIRTIDLEKKLDEEQKPYLHVISKPNWRAKVGEQFSYTLEVLTNAESVKYALQNGPPGAEIDNHGKLSWSIKQMPVGGRVEMAVRVEASHGASKVHRVKVLVAQQPTGGAIVSDDEKTGWIDYTKTKDFARVSETLLQLPANPKFTNPGLDNRQLMQVGKYLCVLKSDGISIERLGLLENPYFRIFERANYYVALTGDKKVCLIDKKNLQVIKSVTLPFSRVHDLVIHPTKPLSYVSGRINNQFPSRKFICFDEQSGEITQNENWIGMFLAMDPKGEYLYSVYEDKYKNELPLFTEEKFARYIRKANKTLLWLIQYRISDPNEISVVAVKPGVGRAFSGLELSDDGRRLICLSREGYPFPTKNNAAWDTSNLRKIPAVYRTNIKGSCEWMKFHPSRPLVVSAKSNTLVLFDRETGDYKTHLVEDPFDMLNQYAISGAYFSPDGIHLIVNATRSGVAYLLKFKLRPEIESSNSDVASEQASGQSADVSQNEGAKQINEKLNQQENRNEKIDATSLLNDIPYGQDVVINLPNKFDAVRIGGSGRFLVFHFKNTGTLKIFDVIQQKFVKDISVPNNALFAAGKRKLLIYSEQNEQLQRWDLYTLELDRTVRVELTPNQPKHIAMGSDSDGPLGVLGNFGVDFLDIQTMKRIDGMNVPISKINTRKPTGLQVSPNGRVFSAHRNIIDFGSDPGNAEFVPFDSPVTIRKENESISRDSRYAIPNNDRSLTLLFGRVLDRNLVDIAIDSLGMAALFPCIDQRYVLSVKRYNANKYELTICTSADIRSIHTLKPFELEGPQPPEPVWEVVGREQCFHYLPQHELVLLLPASREKLILRKFNLEKAVQQSKEKFLYIDSKPIINCLAGDSYQYQLDAKASSAVVYSLVTGPPGMSVSDTGLIQWKAESRPIGGKVFVALTATSKEGLAADQTFDLYINRESKCERQLDSGTVWNQPDSKVGYIPIDDTHSELGNMPTLIHEGINGRLLALAGRDLVVLKNDGWTVEKIGTLDREYTKICERKDYFVAITNTPPEIFVIDKENLHVTRSLRVPFFEIYDIAVHPNQPFSFVTGNTTSGLPTRRMIRFDERNGEAIESYNWPGKFLAIDKSGQYMYSAYQDQGGYPPLMDSSLWFEYPNAGVIEWIIKYKFDENHEPVFTEAKHYLGLNPSGIELSKDGKRLAYLCEQPRTQYSRRIFNAENLQTDAVVFQTVERNQPLETLRFHPSMPLMVTLDGKSPVFYNRETGAVIEDAIEGSLQSLEGLTIDHLYFSPNGEYIVFCAAVEGVEYLHKFRLKKFEPGN